MGDTSCWSVSEEEDDCDEKKLRGGEIKGDLGLVRSKERKK